MDERHTLRRFIWLLLLIMLVIGAVFASRALADWRYIVPDAPGTLLYATGFDAPDLSSDWEQAQGRLSAQIDGGVMRLDVGAPSEGVFAPLRWYLNDFDVRVQAIAASGPEDNGFGVLFRQRDLDNYYYFLISSDGYYRVTQVTDGVSDDFIQWMPSEVIETGIGASNTLRVTGQGDQFQFYINEQPVELCLPDDPDAQSTYNAITGECVQGQMLTTLIDNTHAYGRVGVMAIALDTPDVAVDFDQVVIYSPTDAATAPDAASALNLDSYTMTLP